MPSSAVPIRKAPIAYGSWTAKGPWKIKAASESRIIRSSRQSSTAALRLATRCCGLSSSLAQVDNRSRSEAGAAERVMWGFLLI